jgi:hypothetical protein
MKRSKSNGPKTARGKARSAQNAITHGFFSSQLASTEEEKALLAELRAQLRQDLAPEGPLLELSFDRVVACHWKFRRAMRLDQQCTTGWLRATAAAEPAGDGKGKAEGNEPAVLSGVYVQSLQSLRRQMALLDQVESRLSPTMRPALLEELRRVFGEPMAELMAKWEGPTEAHLMYASVQRKNEIFNVPQEQVSFEVQTLLEEAGQDLRLQGQQAQLHWLRGQVFAAWQEAQRAAQSFALGGSLSPELAQRYETGAARQLDRALAQYFALKDRAERKREEGD